MRYKNEEGVVHTSVRWIHFIALCDICYPLWTQLKLIRKIFNLLQQTWNSVVSLIFYLYINCVNVCSIRFHHVHLPLLGVRSSLCEPHGGIFRSFFGTPRSQYPRQPPSSPNGSPGTASVMNKINQNYLSDVLPCFLRIWWFCNPWLTQLHTWRKIVVHWRKRPVKMEDQNFWNVL